MALAAAAATTHSQRHHHARPSASQKVGSDISLKAGSKEKRKNFKELL